MSRNHFDMHYGGEPDEMGAATWRHDIKPGDKLRRRTIHDDGPGRLVHVRAVVDGIPVVRWYRGRHYGWHYELLDNPLLFGRYIVRDGAPI